MRSPRLLLVLTLPAAAWLVAASPRVDAGAGGSAPPVVALLGGVPGEASTGLHLVPVGARELPPAVATLAHLPEAVVRGRALPGPARAVVAVADVVPARDPSWAAALFRLAPGEAPLQLADGVHHASRPLVTDEGRVLVERGVAGAEPAEAEIRAGRLRVDALRIDEVSLDGRSRTLHRGAGYATHLVGARGAALYVYRVGPEGADLVALDLERDAGRQEVRRITALAPFARDFSLDEGGRIVFTTHEGRDRGAPWQVERVDPASGARETLAHLDGQGRGLDWVRAVATDRAWTALLHFPPGPSALPRPIAVRAGDGARIPLPTAPRLRFEIAGFVEVGR